MIDNQRQYQITNDQIELFKEALAQAEHESPQASEQLWIHEALLDGMRSQIQDLQTEVNSYEILQSNST